MPCFNPACRAVHILDFIESLPQGWDTVVAEAVVSDAVFSPLSRGEPNLEWVLVGFGLTADSHDRRDGLSERRPRAVLMVALLLP